MAGSCELVNERPGSIKDMEFLNQSGAYQLLSGPVTQLVQRLATGWTVLESNPFAGEIFRTCPDRSWGPLSLLYNGYRVFPGGKERPGRDVDPSPPSSSVVVKEQSYTSTPSIGRTACTEPQCLYKGAIYFLLASEGLLHGVSYITSRSSEWVFVTVSLT